MILSELTEGMTWAKRGNKVVRKFRCVSGRRKSRVVSSPAQCFAAPDLKKRENDSCKTWCKNGSQSKENKKS